MASRNYIGTTWAGESGTMMNTVLRDEWGFQGMVESDYFRDNGHGFVKYSRRQATGFSCPKGRIFHVTVFTVFTLRRPGSRTNQP